MSEFTDFEQLKEAMREFSKALANGGFKKKEPISALLIEGVFPNEEGEEAYITFDDDILVIESRDRTDNYVAFTSKELWQIVAFALDNGLELPQNEDEKE